MLLGHLSLELFFNPTFAVVERCHFFLAKELEKQQITQKQARVWKVHLQRHFYPFGDGIFFIIWGLYKNNSMRRELQWETQH